MVQLVNPLKTTQVLTLPVALAHSPIGTNGERFRGSGRRLWNLAAQARLGVEGRKFGSNVQDVYQNILK